jgi:hypothetical protein
MAQEAKKAEFDASAVGVFSYPGSHHVNSDYGLGPNAIGTSLDRLRVATPLGRTNAPSRLDSRDSDILPVRVVPQICRSGGTASR